MNEQTFPPKAPPLPGVPVIIIGRTGQREIVPIGRVLRDRSGRVMLCKNSVEGEAVAKAATKFLGRGVILVHFVGKKGARIEQVGFAVSAESGGTMAKSDHIALEAMIFFGQEQKAKSKAKWKALAAPTNLR